MRWMPWRILDSSKFSKLFNCFCQLLSVNGYNIQREIIYNPKQLVMLRKLWFADLVKLYFLHNKTSKTNQMLKVRHSIISWKCSLILNLMAAACPKQTEAQHCVVCPLVLTTVHRCLWTEETMCRTFGRRMLPHSCLI